MKRLMIKYLFLFFHLLFSINVLIAKESIKISTFDVFEDKSNTLSYEEVLNQQFTQFSELNFGYSPSSFWVKINIDTFFVDNINCIVLSGLTIQEVEFYYFENNNLTEVKFAGIANLKNNKKYVFDKFYKKIKINANQEDFILIKLYNPNSSLKTSVYIQSQNTMLNDTFSSIVLFFIFFGISIIMLLYNFMNFRYFKDKVFLFFSSYLIFLLMFQGYNHSFFFYYTPDFLLEHHHIMKIIWMLPLTISLLLFNKELIDIEVFFSKKVLNLYNLLIITFGLFVIPLILPLNNFALKFILFTFFYLLFFVSLILMFYTGVVAAKNGHKPARYFLIGQIPILLFYVLVILRNFKIIPSFEFLNELNLILLLFESVVMFVCVEKHLKIKKIIALSVIDSEQDNDNENENTEITYKDNTNKVLKSLITKTSSINKVEEVEIDEESIKLFEKIKSVIEEKELYLKSDLKIVNIAEELNESIHQISKAINDASQTHFFDFINSYRINHAKKLLKNEELSAAYTIETIASMSGFNNKTTFNKAFKKFTNQTASQFRQKLSKLSV